MFWGALNALLGSVANIFWKKSLDLSDLPPRVFYALGALGSVVLSLGLIAFGMFSLPANYWLLAIPTIDAVIVGYTGLLSQRIYKEEKISALLPYENLSSILTIVAAFFLLGNTSVATLLIAIVTIVIIFTASFDFKGHQFPKNFKLIVLSNSITAFRALAMGYALSHMATETFYSIRNLLNAAIVMIPLLLSAEWVAVKTMKKDCLVPRMAASFLGAISALIAFTLISRLGLVTTTLLGFLSMAATLVLGYAFLGDRPERKNVMLAIAVSALVAVGTYFRAP
ncbi:MAG: hypothetical protein QG650_1110 [Patescibacteria group bacterium]|nr:hypothetical protein [Patescibacteria group bacterium]